MAILAGNQLANFLLSKCWSEHLARHVDLGHANQDSDSNQETKEG
jgi:hypothetical protein